MTAVLVHSSHELVDEFRKLFAELSRILIDFHGFLQNVASNYCSARLPISNRIEVDVSLSRRGQLRLPLRWLTWAGPRTDRKRPICVHRRCQLKFRCCSRKSEEWKKVSIKIVEIEIALRVKVLLLIWGLHILYLGFQHSKGNKKDYHLSFMFYFECNFLQTENNFQDFIFVPFFGNWSKNASL